MYVDSGSGSLVQVVTIGTAAVFVAGTVQIVRRAGYSGWFALLALAPIVNILAFLLFAFREWPVQSELREAQERTAPGP
jgi:hypothetical protein